MEMAYEAELTFRQIVLVKLLTSDIEVFGKRDMVPRLLSTKEWKYCNSLVDGNAIWFGGRTVRKPLKERAKVHHKHLGLDRQIKLITHANRAHTRYALHKDNIKRYLLHTLSMKYDSSKLTELVNVIEQDNNIQLRDYVEVEA